MLTCGCRDWRNKILFCSALLYSYRNDECMVKTQSYLTVVLTKTVEKLTVAAVDNNTYQAVTVNTPRSPRFKIRYLLFR